ncbi:MAG: AAA family ATPase [Verrucomicrobiales bacterium]|nr:AAA family ATPase [Verrucomicrobiales bacterium]
MLSTAAEVFADLAGERAEAGKVTALSLAELPAADAADPGELIRDRYLCRGATTLLVGRTGLGKSSLAAQLAICWALGREAFGFRPSARLRSLIVQSENDANDLAEMVAGVFAGLELSAEERAEAAAFVRVATVDDATGEGFVNTVLRPLVKQHKPDLIWLDPLFGFLGADVSDQAAVSAFLRLQLAPLLHAHNCALVLLHHTPKPPREEQRNGSAPTTDLAYAGAGSAELANFPRSVLYLEPTHSPELFKLKLGKRGRRLGWREPEADLPAYERLIAHGRGGIFWRDPEPGEEFRAVSPSGNRGDLLQLIPSDKPIAKDALISLAKTRAGLGEKRAAGLLAELLDAGEAFEWRIRRPGTNPKRFIARHPQPFEAAA